LFLADGRIDPEGICQHQRGAELKRHDPLYLAFEPAIISLLVGMALTISGCCGDCVGCSDRIELFEQGNTTNKRFVVQDISDRVPGRYLGVGMVHDYWISDAELTDDHEPTELKDIQMSPSGVVEIVNSATSSLVLRGLKQGSTEISFQGTADGGEIDDSFLIEVVELESLLFEQYSLTGRQLFNSVGWWDEPYSLACTNRAVAGFEAQAPIIARGSGHKRIIGVGDLPLKLVGGPGHELQERRGQPENVRMLLGSTPGRFELQSTRFVGKKLHTRMPMIAEDPVKVNGHVWIYAREPVVHQDDVHINPRPFAERKLGLVRVIPTMDGEPLCGALVPARAKTTSKGICKVAPYSPGKQVAFVEEASSPDGYFRLRSTGYGSCGLVFTLILGEEVITEGEAFSVEIEAPSGGEGGGGGGWDWD